VAVIIAATVLLVWRLELRHHRKYVSFTHGGRTIQALLDVPARPQKESTVVVLVHEIYGLSDWAKGMADELADQGFIVVAPDLLSGHGPKGGGYSDFTNENDVMTAVSELDPAIVSADLDAAVDYARTLPAINGKIAIVGFSWGGWKSFAFATHRDDLSGVFDFYGTGPTDVTPISAPVYGFYAGDDGGVDVTVPATTDAMKAAGKLYEPVTYEGADHGFMRLGEQAGNANPANKTARDRAFGRLIKLLKGMEITKGTLN
jgi:carboxymethylenebutenolidase